MAASLAGTGGLAWGLATCRRTRARTLPPEVDLGGKSAGRRWLGPAQRLTNRAASGYRWNVHALTITEVDGTRQMGIFYIVGPLDSQAQAWLRAQEIPFTAAPSRLATRDELRAVLGELQGFKIEYTENGPGQAWSALVENGVEDGVWTLLCAKPENNDDARTKVHFENGEPTLIVAILRALSRVTGPLVLVADVGGPPMVVTTS